MKSHKNKKDAWVAIYDKVYNVTNFLADHPGGAKALLNVCGKDSTSQFEEQNHGEHHLKILKPFMVGN